MPLKIQKPKGTNDILPAEISNWHYLENSLRRIFEIYNFAEIRTPIFEETELFARGIGQTTDIVQKEMYTFSDKSGGSFSLRPEMTASVVRAFLQHHLGDVKAVQKLYYISPMFRHERPQAGRFRQFHQYGVEILGTQEPLADVEIITIGIEVLNSLGVTGLTLKLNNVGCQICRPGYKKQLQDELKPVFDKLCGDCQNRYSKNPLRILDCKKGNCRNLTDQISPIDDFLCEECNPHFKEVKVLLREIGIPFEQDKRLVRGLDYYTKTAFEIVTNQLGAQDAICGGGRYDLLAEELGGKPVPSVGFAAGMERLLTVLEKLDLFPDFQQEIDVYLIGLGDEARKWLYAQALLLRREKVTCELDFQNRSLKAQMREANKLNSKFVAIIGEKEISDKKIPIKNMDSGEQEFVTLEQFGKEVERLCKT